MGGLVGRGGGFLKLFSILCVNHYVSKTHNLSIMFNVLSYDILVYSDVLKFRFRMISLEPFLTYFCKYLFQVHLRRGMEVRNSLSDGRTAGWILAGQTAHRSTRA